MKKFILALILVNFIGFLYGLIYYKEQLSSVPYYFWLFVIDCPLYTILMAFVFLFLLLKIKNNFFTFLVSTGAVKYGIWTCFVLLFYGKFFFSPQLSFESTILFLLHIGLILEGLLFVGTLNINKKILAATIFWFLFNDYLDYNVGLHPALPLEMGGIEVIIYFTVIASIAVPLLLYLFDRKKVNFYSWNKTLSKIRE